MDKCIHCDNVFTKRGIKRHINYCKKKVDDNKIVQKMNIYAVPFECMKLVQEYLMHKETYVTYKRFFAMHLNYALTCKFFHAVFMPEEYHSSYSKESNTLIHRKLCQTLYGLTDKDLDIVYGNKKHRNTKQKDKIYKLSKIMDYAYTKYGSYNNYITEKTRIEMERKKKEELQLLERKTRKEILVELLKQHNLVLRQDSTLCFNYIENGVGEVNEIVTTMLEMDFYFKYTKYSTILSNIKSNYIYNARSYMIFDDWNSYYSLSNEEKQMLSESAKKTALEEWCKKCKDAINQPYLPVSLHKQINDFCVK